MASNPSRTAAREPYESAAKGTLAKALLPYDGSLFQAMRGSEQLSRIPKLPHDEEWLSAMQLIVTLG